ncbi:MAG TPA: PP2C family protein-serine/threonine phosphatase [Vicinamibacterales bacterium]|nr:PP2C family protein-serine/threonine phosphatase [Vicinamibacterales bacterium]
MASPSRIDNRALWRSLSRVALGRVLVGVFFIFAIIGFVVDVFDPRSSSFGWVLLTCAYSGAIAALYLLAFTRNLKLLVVVVAGQLLVTFAIARFLPHGAPLVPAGDASLQRRLYLDGAGIVTCIAAAWAWMVAVVNRQALELVTATFELNVAQRLQTDLVPAISLTTPYLVAAGRSVPSTQMGGDLVDAVEAGDEVVAYVADVSGHGIAAGVLMAVVKSALRTHLLTPRPLSSLLKDLNAVLPGLKDDASYVTMAAVRVRSDGVVEYALGGHLPILHFRRRTREIVELTLPQMAIGMFPAASYESATSRVEPGDLLVLVTDGLTETFDAGNEEFGLARIGAVVSAHADEQPEDIITAVLTEVRRHGPQLDDRTVLVIAIQ